eukprot:gene28932-32125_t
MGVDVETPKLAHVDCPSSLPALLPVLESAPMNLQTAVSSRASVQTSRPVVRVQAHAGEKALISAVAFAAATLLSAAPSQAGVILVQPKLKKAFQQVEAPAFVRTEQGIVSPPKAPNPQAVSESAGGGGFQLDPLVIALPGMFCYLSAALSNWKMAPNPQAVSESAGGRGFQLDSLVIALPVCVGAIGALAFGAFKLDDEFETFIKKTLIKASKKAP